MILEIGERTRNALVIALDEYVGCAVDKEIIAESVALLRQLGYQDEGFLEQQIARA